MIRGPYSDHNGTWVNGDWTGKPGMIVGGWLADDIYYAVIFDSDKASKFLAGDKRIEVDAIVRANDCVQWHTPPVGVG